MLYKRQMPDWPPVPYALLGTRTKVKDMLRLRGSLGYFRLRRCLHLTDGAGHAEEDGRDAAQEGGHVGDGGDAVVDRVAERRPREEGREDEARPGTLL